MWWDCTAYFFLLGATLGVGKHRVLECLISAPMSQLPLWSPPLQSWPWCCLGSLIPGVWPCSLTAVVLGCLLCSCHLLAKIYLSICFITLLDTLLALIPIHVFVFWYVFPLILVWLAMLLSKASLGAFLTCLWPLLVRLRNPLKDIFITAFLLIFR